MKRLAEKAAALSIHTRKVLISELKEESAASAYRGALFEADVIDRLVCGSIFQVVKCSSEEEGARQEISMELSDTKRRNPMVMHSLDSLDVLEVLDRIVVPDARNFESVDAFRVSSTPVFSANSSSNCSPQYEIVGYQMTVDKNHPIKYRCVQEIVEKVKGSVPPNAVVLCVVVFVVPDDVQTEYSAPQKNLKIDGSVRKTRGDATLSDHNQYRLVINY
eukprot:scaffold39247_cov59-Attheya_sp.AAC.1